MTRYKLISTKIEGEIIITYMAGFLVKVSIEVAKPLEGVQFNALMHELIWYGEDLLDPGKWQLMEVLPVNVKIALFCDFYKKYNSGLKYKVSKAEAGKIKHLAINEELLTAYFRSENFLFKGKYSISNLVKYYNELRAEMNSKGAHKYPNYYSREQAAKYSGKEYTGYIAHLRGLGLKPKMNGNVMVDML